MNLRIILLICILRYVTGQDTESNNEATTNPTSCYDDEFTCKNGECIGETKECDMIEDCADLSDEHEDCKNFSCESGDMVPERFHCDGFTDCDDNSDEVNCEEFTCTNGKTVMQKQVCDQIDDCGDIYRSDECNCTYTFTCANGRCISNDLVCDQVNDCDDKSDEDNCETARFTCFNGQEIEADLKCNGKADCDDTSDECVCMGTFTCNNQRCVSAYLINDGNDDCGDGSDETMVKQTAPPRPDNSAKPQKEEVKSALDSTDESSGYEFNSTNSIVDSNNVTMAYMTSPIVPTFFCANGMIIDHELLCDGTDDCEDGYRSDECNCDDTFECAGAGRKRCIVSDLRCDGFNDCYDKLRSDECGCDDTFTCAVTKECLPKTDLCDGTENCADGSDEDPVISGCPVSSPCEGGYLCGNGKCINKTLSCNGVDDCGDCSDEEKCTRPGNLFQCKSGECIDKQKHCDGKDDCPTGDDEADCDVTEKAVTESTTTTSSTTKNQSPVHTREHTVTEPGNNGKKLTPLIASNTAYFTAIIFIYLLMYSNIS